MRSTLLLIFLLTVLNVLAPITFAENTQNVEGRLITNHVLDDLANLEPTTRVMLHGGKGYSALVRKDGKFVIDDVAPGSYLLDVLSRKYIYPKLRVDVSGMGVTQFLTMPGFEWGSLGPAVSYPLELAPRDTAKYFVEREGFSIASIFANPLLIMMGVSVLMLFVMPKMMANLDPEELEQMKKNQPAINPLEQLPDISSTLANWGKDKGNKK
ncbi:7965_t:CDS:2 [Ambispora gerdemannii]|uniref:7965_t:CDS:1 n=1 Tax=Ambispora gerdemannii TaxID=144530 RepID=A0A9N8YRD1_9GLOM|nr:7965_t:CDS:2 [Ambispora gerdemannii]